MTLEQRKWLDDIAGIQDPHILCDMLASDVQFARTVIKAVKAVLVDLDHSHDFTRKVMADVRETLQSLDAHLHQKDSRIMGHDSQP